MNEKAQSGHSPPELHTLLTEQTVRAKVEVTSWEEAADQVGQLLVDADSIEPRYVEAMKDTLKRLGPYMVIAPGIALLHARPEDGVRQLCLGLLSLSNPVRFGHSENDPVDLVLALGAVDKETHVTALQQLSQLLMDEEILSRIRSAPDVQTLVSAVRSRNSDKT